MNSTGRPSPVAEPGRAVDRLDRIGHHLVGDLGVVEAHREIAPPVAGRHHRPPGQALEGDVPEPDGIEPVGDPGVDRHDDRARSPVVEQVEELLPPGRVLGQQEPGRHAGHAGGARTVRPRPRSAPSPASGRLAPATPEHRGGDGGHHRVAPVERARDGELDRQPRPSAKTAVVVPSVALLDRHVGDRPGEVARARPRPPSRRRSDPRRPGTRPRRRATAGPPATHTTERAEPAAEATIGSSALATTGRRRRRPRARLATGSTSIRTSSMRSSWSRERLRRTMTCGLERARRSPAR